MNSNYDFYSYGEKVAKENQLNVEKLSKEIIEKYGIEANDDFYRGYVNALSILLTSSNKSVVENSILKQDEVKDIESTYKEIAKNDGIIR